MYVRDLALSIADKYSRRLRQGRGGCTMSKVKMNLQLFADKDENEIEIPEEFSGIDREIALELMREHGLIPDKQEDKQPGQEPSDDQNKEPDQNTDPEEGDPAAGLAPDKEPEAGEDPEGEDDNKKTVPLAALKDERGKRKNAQRELEALKAEIAQLRAQNQQPQSGRALELQQFEEKKAQEAQDGSKNLRRQFIDKAKAIFVQENGREPDNLDDADSAEIMFIATELKGEYERVQSSQQRALSERQQLAQTYQQFAIDQKNRDDWEEVAAAVEAEFEALPEDEKAILGASYQRCEAGQGTLQDIYLVKKFWNAAADKANKAAAPAEKPKPTEPKPEPKKKTTEEKLQEIEKHPKANLLNGSNTQGGDKLADLARKMQDGWDTLTDEEKELVLNLE